MCVCVWEDQEPSDPFPVPRRKAPASLNAILPRPTPICAIHAADTCTACPRGSVLLSFSPNVSPCRLPSALSSRMTTQRNHEPLQHSRRKKVPPSRHAIVNPASANTSRKVDPTSSTPHARLSTRQEEKKARGNIRHAGKDSCANLGIFFSARGEIKTSQARGTGKFKSARGSKTSV